LGPERALLEFSKHWEIF